jgi:hypothetical protein
LYNKCVKRAHNKKGGPEKGTGAKSSGKKLFDFHKQYCSNVQREGRGAVLEELKKDEMGRRNGHC